MTEPLGSEYRKTSTIRGDPSEMKPCPWCASAGWVIEDYGIDGREPLLYRPQCKACGGGHGGFDMRARAIAAWNRRTPDVFAATHEPVEGVEWGDVGELVARLRSVNGSWRHDLFATLGIEAADALTAEHAARVRAEKERDEFAAQVNARSGLGRAYSALTEMRQPQAADGGFEVTPELVSYILRYGGMCRACADEHGICPSSGLPCENDEKAVRFVLGALSYGLRHGFVALAKAAQIAALDQPKVGGGELLSVAEQDVISERSRQIQREGYTPDHDDEHSDGAIAKAAACYAVGYRGLLEGVTSAMIWPRGWEFKSDNRRRELVKAGALVIAEIERIDRLTQPSQIGGEG